MIDAWKKLKIAIQELKRVIVLEFRKLVKKKEE